MNKLLVISATILMLSGCMRIHTQQEIVEAGRYCSQLGLYPKARMYGDSVVELFCIDDVGTMSEIPSDELSKNTQ